MQGSDNPKKKARPYFMPEGIDFESLPKSVKTALGTVVGPAYDELVLGAPNTLERSMGVSFVFLLAQEVLYHFEIGRQMNLAQSPNDAHHQQREQNLSRYLKLFGAKNSALAAILRLRKMQAHQRAIPAGPSFR